MKIKLAPQNANCFGWVSCFKSSYRDYRPSFEAMCNPLIIMVNFKEQMQRTASQILNFCRKKKLCRLFLFYHNYINSGIIKRTIIKNIRKYKTTHISVV